MSKKICYDCNNFTSPESRGYEYLKGWCSAWGVTIDNEEADNLGLCDKNISQFIGEEDEENRI